MIKQGIHCRWTEQKHDATNHRIAHAPGTHTHTGLPTTRGKLEQLTFSNWPVSAIRNLARSDSKGSTRWTRNCTRNATCNSRLGQTFNDNRPPFTLQLTPKALRTTQLQAPNSHSSSQQPTGELSGPNCSRPCDKIKPRPLRPFIAATCRSTGNSRRCQGHKNVLFC